MKAIRKIIAALVALSACMSYTFALADNVNTNYSDSAYQTVSTVADSGKCGDNLKWELDTNGTITISGTGEMSEYAFQTSQHQFTAEENEQYMQELENHKFPWFEKNSPELITNIIIEDGVESISDMAFYGTSIKSISLPNSVKKIGKSSIANCAELEKITLSDNISEIPTGAFNSDYKLTSIELPTKLTSIGASAFLNCESLESIDIPDTVTEIGDRAFANSGLRMLVIPSGVTAVNYDLCNENHNLNEVVFSPNTKSVEMTAFSGCSNLKNIDLPDGLEKIGKMAFLSSVNARIYIPQSVTDIEKKAFNDNAVIYGYANSAAEEFAKNNDIKFVAVNSHDEYLSLLTYSDTDNSSYKSAIDELSQLGIINGFEDGTFKPQDNVTRAQAATMFATALGYSDTKYQNIATDKAVFSDFLMSHWAYKYADYVMKSADISSGETNCILSGFEDGTFRPDNNMSRAEAAAIFARLISEQKGEKISGKSDFADVKSNEWYSKFIGYIKKYGIIKGYDNNTFKPDENISRAEFVAMTVRFNSLFNDVKKGSYTVKYTDVASNYWAYSDIAYAKHAGWLNGYADGSFKGDNAITRAEVVTVVNKATGRTADEGYINKNLSSLNKFTDLKNNSHWAFYAIAESANTHIGVTGTDNETWVK